MINLNTTLPTQTNPGTAYYIYRVCMACDTTNPTAHLRPTVIGEAFQKFVFK